MENKKWYVVNTKPKQEKKVTELLERKGIVSFIPEQKQNYNWHGKERIVTTVVFPSLLFVLTNEEEHLNIRKLDGVVGILFWLQKPAFVHEEEISTLKQFLNIHDNVVVEKVRVIPNMDNSSIDSVYNRNKVVDISGEYEKLILPSIGFSLLAKTLVNEYKRFIA